TTLFRSLGSCRCDEKFRHQRAVSHDVAVGGGEALTSPGRERAPRRCGADQCFDFRERGCAQLDGARGARLTALACAEETACVELVAESRAKIANSHRGETPRPRHGAP